MTKLLTQQQIKKKLEVLSEDWVQEDNTIFCPFSFKDFESSMIFTNDVAEIADNMNHHPDILIHSGNKVEISISTHETEGLTEKDFELATEIDSLLK